MITIAYQELRVTPYQALSIPLLRRPWAKMRLAPVVPAGDEYFVIGCAVGALKADTPQEHLTLDHDVVQLEEQTPLLHALEVLIPLLEKRFFTLFPLGLFEKGRLLGVLEGTRPHTL